MKRIRSIKGTSWTARPESMLTELETRMIFPNRGGSR